MASGDSDRLDFFVPLKIFHTGAGDAEARKGTVYFSPFDLQTDLDGAQVYSSERVKDFVSRYLAGEDREELDPILEACVEVCLQDLDEDGQVQFKR